MIPDKEINGIQLDTYLNEYNINTNLDVIHYRESYALNNYIDKINTSLFFKEEEIQIEEIQFKENTQEQEKELIVIALNKLRERVK